METIPVKARGRVRKDIDPATLHRQYYEDGMTIKAIAAQNGVCTATVSKYLGPVRRGPRPKVKGKKNAPQAKIAKQAQAPKAPMRSKQLIPSKIEFRGRTATFEVDLGTGSLYARGTAFEMLLAKDEVEPFIWELVEAYQAMPRREAITAEGTD